MERVAWKHIHCKIGSQWEFAVFLRKLRLGLCDNLSSRCDGVGGGMEAQEEEDIGIPVADSC